MFAAFISYFFAPSPNYGLTNRAFGGNIYRQSTRLQKEYGRVPEWPMGTDCKSAAFSFGGSNPPAPTKNSGIQWVPEFLFYLPHKRGCKGGFEQHRPAEQSGGEKSPCGAFLDARLATSTRAHQELRYPMGTGVSVLSATQKGLQGWIRTASAYSLSPRRYCIYLQPVIPYR